MNSHLIIFASVLLLLIPGLHSLCVTKRTDWGSLGAVFTDPLCDVWCHMRFCGKGQCREKWNTKKQAECICEKCVGYGSRFDTDYSGSSTYLDRFVNQNDYYPRHTNPRSSDNSISGNDKIVNYNPNV